MDEEFLSCDYDDDFDDLEDFELGKNDEINEMGRQAEYRSKALDEIVENFEEEVSHVEETCGVSAEEAIPLLQYFQYTDSYLNTYSAGGTERSY